jgi:hypothetical protein
MKCGGVEAVRSSNTVEDGEELRRGGGQGGAALRNMARTAWRDTVEVATSGGVVEDVN